MVAIVQRDPNKPNGAIRIDSNPSRLVVEPFQGGPTSAVTINLTQFQGLPFRLYVEQDGTLSTELAGDHWWLLAEAIIPEARYEMVETGQVDEHGRPITTMQQLPLDLSGVDILVWPLPEVD